MCHKKINYGFGETVASVLSIKHLGFHMAESTSLVHFSAIGRARSRAHH